MDEAQRFVWLRRRQVAAAAARKGRRRRDLDRREGHRSRRPHRRPTSHTYAVARFRYGPLQFIRIEDYQK